MPWIINPAFRIQEYYQDSSKDTCFETTHTQCLCIFPLNVELTTHKINLGFCGPKRKKKKTTSVLYEYKEKRKSGCIHGSLVPYVYFSNSLHSASYMYWKFKPVCRWWYWYFRESQMLLTNDGFYSIHMLLCHIDPTIFNGHKIYPVWKFNPIQ